MTFRNAASVLSLGLLFAIAVLVMRSIVFEPNRFQVVTFGASESTSFLLDSRSGRVWERRPIPLPNEQSGWFEMARLDAPPGLHVDFRDRWLAGYAEQVQMRREELRKEYDSSVAKREELLRYLKASEEEQVKEIRERQKDLKPLPPDSQWTVITPEEDVRLYPNEHVQKLRRSLESVNSDLKTLTVELSRF